MGTAIVTINSSSSYKKNDMSNKEARKITCSRKVNCHCYSKFWLHKQTHYRCRRYWPNFKQWRLWQWWCKHKQRLRQWEQPNIFHSQRSTTFSALSFKSQDKEKKHLEEAKKHNNRLEKKKNVTLNISQHLLDQAKQGNNSVQILIDEKTNEISV